MKGWSRISVVRRLVAIAMLTAFADATALGAAALDCEAVDVNGEPRDCTFSEQLGECAYNAWDSWKQCVDEDGDGYQDVGWLEEQYCNFWAAADLLVCGLTTPLGEILE